ncbi:hypothetical protein [Flavisolibacter ginsenosidimutans]|uniref:Uncharacterized protein n=1 Tax=Flavisolibacter ginsenosidimutans TaxID=661481 RepID=A0A5B8UMW8_9BACT|nr:hypothetical protein [Flavisolibacter ginsenosidimutans]QEC57315.1 hypothetical protein FSB75_15880 [Flavisolibacter ginsenosidimutans]
MRCRDKADFIVLKTTAYHRTAFSRRQVMEFLEMPVYTVSPEDLILAKLLWIQGYQSAIQMQDIRNLLELPTLDKVYIVEWIKELKLTTFDLVL